MTKMTVSPGIMYAHIGSNTDDWFIKAIRIKSIIGGYFHYLSDI
ncbi:hypothetical protein [Citrobacter portucalensis]